MLRATAVRPRGNWTEDAVDSVVLDFDERHRRRVAMTGVRGLGFLLDLPKAVALRGGDALVLEDGGLVEVVAAPEPLVEVRGTSPQALVRLAWHVGNRHLPAQVMASAFRLRRDPVIADMLRGLGAKLVEIEAPFDPEGGAYAPATDPGANHGHHHGPHDDRGHPAHERPHRHDPAHDHGH